MAQISRLNHLILSGCSPIPANGQIPTHESRTFEIIFFDTMTTYIHLPGHNWIRKSFSTRKQVGLLFFHAFCGGRGRRIT
jgi:hypothetical protein